MRSPQGRIGRRQPTCPVIEEGLPEAWTDGIAGCLLDPLVCSVYEVEVEERGGREDDSQHHHLFVHATAT